MSEKKVVIKLNLFELRELYRCVNVCLLDDDYVRAETTLPVFDKIKQANRRLIVKQRRDKK
jgi:hypothetical protein